MRLELGSPVHCSDGPFGELADVVIDPNSLHLTHLVVEPHHRHGQARLAPIERATADGDTIALGLTVAEVHDLPSVQDVSYERLGDQRVTDPHWDVGIETVLTLPNASGYGGFGGDPTLGSDQSYSVVYDRVPKGHVEIRRASGVASADGHHLGHVDGFLVDTEGTLTHLVLERGHLWGRRRITIPIQHVATVASDAVALRITKDEIGALHSASAHRAD